MTVIKRSKSNNANELVDAIHDLIPFLKDQGEDEACDDLNAAADELGKAQAGSDDFKSAISERRGGHRIAVVEEAQFVGNRPSRKP